MTLKFGRPGLDFGQGYKFGAGTATVTVQLFPPESAGAVKVVIYEASSSAGPYYPIEEVSTIGTYPGYITSYTTSQAESINDWFSSQWFDVDDGIIEGMALPIPGPGVNPDAVSLPTTADVATVVMAYAKDSVGNYVGDFTSQTRPTGSQVARIMLQVADDVFADVDDDLPAEALRPVRSLIALGTAMRVTLSFFPELSQGPQSPYDRLKTLYDQQMVRVEKAILREEAEEAEGDEQAGAVLFSFPANDDLWTRRM